MTSLTIATMPTTTITARNRVGDRRRPTREPMNPPMIAPPATRPAAV